MPAELPYLTSELPGCGGLLKAAPEDFEVEELPAYEPSGAGEHLFVWVEKTGRDTAWVARALAEATQVPEQEVGHAGLKDRQARTWQYFSLPARAEPRLKDFAVPGVVVHRAVRHGNKLRTGHLRGNRFRIRLRDVRDAAAGVAVLQALVERGVPNFFGEQRFGRKGDNAELGKRLLLGERLAGRVGRFERRLYLSAFQSRLFNQALVHRMEEGAFARAKTGDVMKKQDTGGLFLCEDAAVDQPRVDRFEISPAGPLFGSKMTASAGQVAEVEAGLLAAEGVSMETFRAGRGETEGTRRAYRIQLLDPRATPEGADLWVSFALPRGSYATVVMRELMKARAEHPGEGDD